MLVSFLFFCNIVSSIALYLSVRKNLLFVEKLEELGSQVTSSLDIIDECYQRIAKISETPVASDDPIVQQLINDIKYTKHAILLIANKVVTFDDEGEEEDGA